MENEEKVKIIIGCTIPCSKCKGTEKNGYCVFFNILMKMSKWKDEEHDECKKDILTLVNLIPCNEENGSIINDIKNLLK